MNHGSHECVIVFDECGARCIYDDALAPTLHAIGQVKVTRASHVEPADSGGWLADMAPSGVNVVLGPFALRSEALEAERQWLRTHLGL